MGYVETVKILNACDDLVQEFTCLLLLDSKLDMAYFFFLTI